MAVNGNQLNALMFTSLYDIGRGTTGRGAEKANEDLKLSLQRRQDQYWEQKQRWEIDQRMSSPSPSKSPKRERNAVKMKKLRAEERQREINQQLIKLRTAEEKEMKEKKQAVIARKNQEIHANKEATKQRHLQQQEIQRTRMMRENEIRKAQHREMISGMVAERAELERSVQEKIRYQREWNEKAHQHAVKILKEEEATRLERLACDKRIQAEKEKECASVQVEVVEILKGVIKKEHTDSKDRIYDRKVARRQRAEEIYKAAKEFKKELKATKEDHAREVKDQANTAANRIRAWEERSSSKRGKGHLSVLMKRSAQNKSERAEHMKEIEADKIKELEWLKAVVQKVSAERAQSAKIRRERNEILMRPKSSTSPPIHQKPLDDY